MKLKIPKTKTFLSNHLQDTGENIMANFLISSIIHFPSVVAKTFKVKTLLFGYDDEKSRTLSNLDVGLHKV